jgi:hypothetical protein
LHNAYKVDVETVSNDKSKCKVQKNVEINDAIDAINEDKLLNDETIRYNLKVQQANTNDINKYFSERALSKKIEVMLDKLDQKTANKLLDQLKSEHVSVEIMFKKSVILSVLRSDANKELIKAVAKVSFDDDSNNSKFEINVDQKRLIEKIDKLKDESTVFYIKFERILPIDAKRIINCFPAESSAFNISFHLVHFSSLNKFLNEEKELLDGLQLSKFSFDDLNRDEAKMFIDVLRNCGTPFTLEFKKLTRDQAKRLLKKADLAQEDIEIGKTVKTLLDMYMKNAAPIAELDELNAKGIQYLIEINEKTFIPWRSIAAVAVLAASQTALGIALICTGFGATIGMSFISEGITDSIAAFNAYRTRQFSWTDYATQKAISISISVASAGLSKLKDAGKGVGTLVSAGTKEGLEAAGSQLLSNGKAVGKELVKAGKKN